jgi:hypothetical protein
VAKAGTKTRLLAPAFGLLLALAALGAFGGMLIWGFVEGRQQAENDAKRDLPIKPPLRVTPNPAGEPIILLDGASQTKSGLKIETAQRAVYREQVRAYGTVLDIANLTTLSTNYVAATTQMSAAEAKLAASSAAFKRAAALHRNEAGSLAQSEAAEATYRSDAAALIAAQSHSRTIAATAIQEWGQTIGTALVQAAPLVQRLIDRQDLLIQVTLPPGLSVEPAKTASIQTGSDTAKVEARLISPAPRTDPKIQGLSFFYLAPAGSGLLPGMSVLAYLSVDGGRPGLTIPPSAIVWHAGKAWIYLRMTSESFTRQAIPQANYERADGGIMIPAAAIPEKAQGIVMEGAQLLLSEEFRAQIQVGEDPNQ